MIPNLSDKHSILIAPLNWGLGHASRSLVLIKHFLKLGKKIGVASDGLALEWLQQELKDEDLDFFELPAYDVDYRSSNMSWNIIRQYPKIQRAIKLENRITKKIVELWKPDIIISDNRYGVFCPIIENILITHQLGMQYAGKLTDTAFQMQISKWTAGFNTIWVPDYEDQRLAGTMSACKKDKVIKFIGPLSRFKKIENPESGNGILIILSGPEPQRTKLEQLLEKQLLNLDEEITFVRGSNGLELKKLNPKYKVITLASSDQLYGLIKEAKKIITRSGYSSLMDFEVLQKKVLMIPTPGQKEQEYLAELHKDHQLMTFCEQGDDLKSAVLEL